MTMLASAHGVRLQTGLNSGVVMGSAGCDPRWAALREYQVDEGDPALPFAARLARENGWSRGFAERVVDEYRRFLYLALTAGHPVTPSDQVDQAWHLHLTYSRSYWDRLCRQVLGRSLHHEPTQGGAAESEKFDDWYARTLECYQAAFGEEAPSDIWPGNGDRFDHDACCRRVNLIDNWVIPKRRVRRLGVLAGVGSVLLAGLAGCGAMVGASNPLAAIGVIVVAVALIGVLAGVLQAVLRRMGNGSRPGAAGCGADGCSTGSSWWWASDGANSDAAHHGGSHHDGGDAHGCSSHGCSGHGCSSGCGGGGD